MSKLMGEAEEMLECVLTSTELAAKKTEVIEILDRLDEADVALDQAKAAHKARKSSLDVALADARQCVATGRERRMVPIATYADRGTGRVYTVREDTGEQIRSRPMDIKERNEPLFDE